ncbi:hypothetical protein [Streptomyces sp. NPDC047061]|uniref:hypothetical protein n=1 Tax=Streptomyces sp. NPDC047061 TaxID=3154605 RepID=UPI0033E13AF3
MMRAPMADRGAAEGCDGTPAEGVYAGAPDLLQEATALTRLAERWRVEACAAALRGEPYEVGDVQERLYLLRRAVLSDRLALVYPDDEKFVIEAAHLADRLAAFDHEHGTHRGPIGPGTITWALSGRLYVRQEYGHRGE